MAKIELWLYLTYFSENRWEHLTDTRQSRGVLVQSKQSGLLVSMACRNFLLKHYMAISDSYIELSTLTFRRASEIP
jgi:hypothetical protein